jgi:hypothetical protein
MNKYLNKIELSRNLRGVWELDPFKGCENSSLNNGMGCYGICYAARIAKAKGYDFTQVVQREFISDRHFLEIVNKLRKIPFVRLGVMCDPSYNWEHTLEVVERIKPYQKNIVIVTKHLKPLNDGQLNRLKGLIINTSICALDSEDERQNRLFWYNELKKHCKSVLRVNTADFNDPNLKSIQEDLLKNDNVIDNILRIPKEHKLVKEGIVNVKKCSFLKTEVYASKHDENIFFSYCDNCLDLCGAELCQNRIIKWIQ